MGVGPLGSECRRRRAVSAVRLKTTPSHSDFATPTPDPSPQGGGECYSAAVLIGVAGVTRTAQNLNSGILPKGSSAGFVSRLAAAST